MEEVYHQQQKSLGGSLDYTDHVMRVTLMYVIHKILEVTSLGGASTTWFEHMYANVGTQHATKQINWG